jgi:hypothetical protein
MTTDVATVEPREVVAGDTWEWEKSFSDYPATTWTLTYYLRSRESEASITAAADGTDHLVTVAKATTAAYKAGLYEITGFVSDATERFQVYRGLLNVLPDPANQGAGQDPRSHAQKTLDAIQAVIENRATKDQQAYTIGGRSLQRMEIKDLVYFEGIYQAKVNGEERKRTGRGSKVVTRL